MESSGLKERKLFGIGQGHNIKSDKPESQLGANLRMHKCSCPVCLIFRRGKVRQPQMDVQFSSKMDFSLL